MIFLPINHKDNYSLFISFHNQTKNTYILLVIGYISLIYLFPKDDYVILNLFYSMNQMHKSILVDLCIWLTKNNHFDPMNSHG